MSWGSCCPGQTHLDEQDRRHRSRLSKTPAFLRFWFKQKSPPLGCIWTINPERVHLVWTGNCLSAAWTRVSGRIPIRSIRTTHWVCWCHTTGPDVQNSFCSPVLLVTTTNVLQFQLWGEPNSHITSFFPRKLFLCFHHGTIFSKLISFTVSVKHLVNCCCLCHNPWKSSLASLSALIFLLSPVLV